MGESARVPPLTLAPIVCVGADLRRRLCGTLATMELQVVDEAVKLPQYILLLAMQRANKKGAH